MFAYCGNNPVNNMDPSGFLDCSIFSKNMTCYNIEAPPLVKGPNAYNSSEGDIIADPPPVTSPVNSDDFRNDFPAAQYGASRGGGTRIHKGVDFYPSDSEYDYMYGTGGTAKTVLSMSNGSVVDYMNDYYCGTAAIVIDHGDYFALYGEISTGLRVGDSVKQGQNIGTMALSWDNTLMLHLEIFEGGYGYYSYNNIYRVDPTYTYNLPDWR